MKKIHVVLLIVAFLFGCEKAPDPQAEPQAGVQAQSSDPLKPEGQPSNGEEKKENPSATKEENKEKNPSKPSPDGAKTPGVPGSEEEAKNGSKTQDVPGLPGTEKSPDNKSGQPGASTPETPGNVSPGMPGNVSPGMPGNVSEKKRLTDDSDSGFGDPSGGTGTPSPDGGTPGMPSPSGNASPSSEGMPSPSSENAPSSENTGTPSPSGNAGMASTPSGHDELDKMGQSIGSSGMSDSGNSGSDQQNNRIYKNADEIKVAKKIDEIRKSLAEGGIGQSSKMWRQLQEEISFAPSPLLADALKNLQNDLAKIVMLQAEEELKKEQHFDRILLLAQNYIQNEEWDKLLKAYEFLRRLKSDAPELKVIEDRLPKNYRPQHLERRGRKALSSLEKAIFHLRRYREKFQNGIELNQKKYPESNGFKAIPAHALLYAKNMEKAEKELDFLIKEIFENMKVYKYSNYRSLFEKSKIYRKKAFVEEMKEIGQEIDETVQANQKMAEEKKE